MRNGESLTAAARRTSRALRGLAVAGLGLSAAACTTIIEEHGYDGLEIGITKTEVLDRLDALPAELDVHAALPRPVGVRPRGRGGEPDVVRLAAASVGAGALSPGERAYLLEYDLWYFEEADGKRSVLLSFDNDDELARIDNRREGSWVEAVF